VTLLVAVLTVGFTVAGSGPFTGSNPTTNLLLLQVFLALLAISTLLLATAAASQRRAEQRFRTLSELAPDMLVQLSAEGVVTSTNPEFAATLGWERHAWLGRRAAELVHPNDRAEFSENLERVVKGSLASVDFTRRLLHRDGHYVRVEGRVLPLHEQGRISGTMVELRDITERLRAEEELRDSRRRLRALSRKLIGSHEAERTRLARELHDQVGQALSTVMMNLEGLHAQVREQARKTSLEDSMTIVERAVQQVRSMSFDLRPSLLDDLGLAAAISAYCRRHAERAGIRVSLDIEPPGPLPSELETVVFRVMQEAVTNVQRHARASHLTVSLRDEHDELTLTVSDDGRGFHARPDTPTPPESYLGIIGMMERAELVGGQVEVESQPDEGTVVRAVFPHSPSSLTSATPTEPLERVST
jgi:PAS domain S-box-containing protein